MGSASEVEYLLVLAGDLSYLSSEQREPVLAAVVEVKRMLTSLLSRLNTGRQELTAER
jgi:four helix bundle protein